MVVVGVFISDIENLTWMMSKIRLAPTGRTTTLCFVSCDAVQSQLNCFESFLTSKKRVYVMSMRGFCCRYAVRRWRSCFTSTWLCSTQIFKKSSFIKLCLRFQKPELTELAWRKQIRMQCTNKGCWVVGSSGKTSAVIQLRFLIWHHHQ